MPLILHYLDSSRDTSVEDEEAILLALRYPGRVRRLVAMSNQHQRIALLGEFDRLDMDLRHQRTGGVNNLQPALLGPVTDRRRNPMRGINNPGAFRDLIQLIDEDRALLRQISHNIAVMNDFLADVDRRAKGIQRNLDDVDGTHNTCAKAARLEKKNSLGFRFVAAPVFSDGLKSGCSHVYKYTAFNSWQGLI